MRSMNPKTPRGSIHPVTRTVSEIATLLGGAGYAVARGPEIETEYYNFDALNIPRDHPAREMHDTFWIKDRQGELLRTHTSPMQVRYMERNEPPIRVIVPGKVFRNEATDDTHETRFHQVEGLCVTEDATLAEMKGTLEAVISGMFGDGVETRYRPTFFPFTEPSIEVDMRSGDGGEWLEILGCGMVHRQVLARVGIDPNRFQGFAFGIGVDRVIMIRNQIQDIRQLYTGDLRVLRQI